MECFIYSVLFNLKLRYCYILYLDNLIVVILVLVYIVFYFNFCIGKMKRLVE